MTLHRLSLVVLALCLGSSVALAKQKPEVLAVSGTIGPAQIAAGDVGEAEVIVQNTSDVAVAVTIKGVIEYADGTADHLMDVKRRTAITLQPGQGFIVNLLFFVPPDAAAGEAIFTTSARVVDVEGAGNGTVQKRAGDSASFEVVEP
jgi:hypothetical protein